MSKIGVALSGGGHRASAFSLGVLLYLADSGKNADVGSISSVSGGSITNGYVGFACNFEQTNGATFRDAARPLANRIAVRGTLWAWTGTFVYLALVIAGLIGCFCVLELTPHPLLRWVAFLVAILVWGWLLLAQRGRVCGWALRATLFEKAPLAPQLAALAPRAVQHVICATDLQVAEHVYFAGRFVYSYRFGLGGTGKLPLHVAIQASSAFPGGFPIRWLWTRRFRFRGGADPQAAKARQLALIDGGVYNNMGEQWLIGAADRAARITELEPDIEVCVPDTVIVVNSSSNFGFQSARKLRIPIVTELLTMVRVADAMYDNTTTTRRRRLNEMFKQRAPAGTTVMIDRSPATAALAVHQGSAPPEMKSRAEAALKALGIVTPAGEIDSARKDEWEQLAERNANVPTTLRALGVETTAELMQHGYVAAMANLHTFLDMPLLGVPDKSEFASFIRG